MPGDAVIELVVEDSQAGLVMELLETLDGDANIVFSLNRTLSYSLCIIWLRFSIFPIGAPECLWVWSVCGRDPLVAGSGPEPSIHIDGLEVGPVTTLVLEVTFTATGVDRGHIISPHDLLKHFVLPRGVERDKVHTPVPAEVATIEPVPVLKLVPGLPPGEKIVVIPHLHVCLSFHALLEYGSVEEGLAIRTYPCRLLGYH